jgi:hypothetical protein
MSDQGITISPGSVIDPDTFDQALQYLKSWYDGLEPTFKQAADQLSAANSGPAAALGQVNVAPALPGLLADFDNAIGWPTSTLIDWCVYCVQQARQAATSQNA